MMLGFGWCHLRSDRRILAEASKKSWDVADELINHADKELLKSFRSWMQQNEGFALMWELHERLNNHEGLLTFCVSRNHRSIEVWAMLDLIAKNGTGSYGLFYCHDDEDFPGDFPDRNNPQDFSNVFRVHRILNGSLTTLPDPLFGPIVGGIEPIHPLDCGNELYDEFNEEAE